MIIGKELLNEKSLWDVYRQCLLLLKPSTFNLVATLLTFVALALDAAYFPENFPKRVTLIRSLADLGISLGSTVLGFLIAGFTIFATLSKPELFLRMHQTKYGVTGLSYLQVNFFTFVEVFAVYIFFVITCLALKLFCSEGGLVVTLLKLGETRAAFGYTVDRIWWINIAFVVLGTLTLYSLLALKSFIFNIYHTVMTSVVWAFNPQRTDWTD
jgi:hypothetical protein